MGYMQTKVRKSVYEFAAEIAPAFPVHIFVRKGESMDTLEEVSESAKSIGKYIYFTI